MNTSLKNINEPLPIMVSQKTQRTNNGLDFNSSSDDVARLMAGFEDTSIDNYLPEGVSELMKYASFEFNQGTQDASKYGREIDIYALIDSQGDDSKEIEEMNIYDQLDEYRKYYEPDIKITPLSVSVQSAKAKMSMPFDLREIAQVIEKSIESNKKKKKKFSILGVFYKDIQAGIIKKPKPRKKGAFPNNMALLVHSPMGTEKDIHMKIFKNSSISMVGCKIKEDGIAVTRILEQYILKQSKLFKSKEDKKKFKIRGFETTMVNSNYSIGFKVDRNRLFTFMNEEYPSLFSSYDPAVYAAVKLGFYYNSITESQDGICKCPGNPCTLDKSTAGKGCGTGVGQCKKVTIAIFESGNIVITGGRNIKQANVAYDYINNIIRENAKRFALINLADIRE